MNKTYILIGAGAVTTASILIVLAYRKGRKDAFSNAGKNILDGIKDGLKTRSPSVEMDKALKGYLNIQSPSHPSEAADDICEEDEDYWEDQTTIEDLLTDEQMEEVSEKMDQVVYPCPYPIDEKEYLDQVEVPMEGYDKVQLFYYEEEGMVMDEDDALIDDDIVLGPHALESFMEGDRSDIFIRNLRLQTDFRVSWRDAFYQDGDKS